MNCSKKLLQQKRPQSKTEPSRQWLKSSIILAKNGFDVWAKVGPFQFPNTFLNPDPCLAGCSTSRHLKADRPCRYERPFPARLQPTTSSSTCTTTSAPTSTVCNRPISPNHLHLFLHLSLSFSCYMLFILSFPIKIVVNDNLALQNISIEIAYKHRNKTYEWSCTMMT